MCGISGIVKFKTPDVTVEQLKQMSDVIAHRGPDGEGHWVSDDRQVGFAHRRLSIIDLSSLANQPMHYLNRYTITFNGEIYNYIELKEMLLSKGYHFQSHSDTEVLMALYDFAGYECLSMLDGMFAFALYDKKEKKIFCARDRFGEKPFYYNHVGGEHFIFASEMKAIHALSGKGSINNKMLFNYLAFGYVDNRTDFTETFYADIRNLPQANYLVIDLVSGNITQKNYWEIKTDDPFQPVPDAATVSKNILELFYKGLNRRLRSDVAVGSSLSGGLDSSIIVCAINQLLNNSGTGQLAGTEGSRQKTFSARFPGFARDEGKYMQMVIDSTNVDPFFTYPTEDTLLNELDKVAYHQEEPFGSTSILAQYEVMKLARENNVTVLLDGQGADEIFAGYHGYYNAFFRELESGDAKLFAAEWDAYQKLHSDNQVNEKPKKHLGHYARKYFPSQVNRLRFFKMLIKQKRNRYFNNDFFHEYRGQYVQFENSFNSLNDELAYSSMRGDLQVLLRFADRNSMAHSREVRLPFLYHELVEYAFRLPATYKIHEGWTKWILRNSFQDLLPEDICWRKDKIGYEPPQKNWMANKQVKDKIISATESLVDQRILDKAVLKKRPSEHGTSERGNNEWAHLMTSYLKLT